MLKIYFQNVNGLGCKQKLLYQAVCESDYDCIVLVETKLNAKICSSKLFPDYYKVFRHDRSTLNSQKKKKSSGGVLIAMHERFNCRQLEINAGIEHIAIEVDINDGHKIIISNSYIPPELTVDVYADHFRTIMRCWANTNDSMLILGDFNLPKVEWVNQGSHMMYLTKNRFISGLHSNELFQINHIFNDMNRMLDLIFTNMHNRCVVARAAVILIEEKELKKHKAITVKLCL